VRKTLMACAALSVLYLSAPPAGAAGIGAVPVVTGLDFPAAFTFAPDGRIFYTDTYTGEIHIYDPSNGSDTLFFTLTGNTGVQGILGLLLAPTYPTQPYLFAHVTRTVQSVLVDQVVRIRDDGGVGTQPKLIYQADAGSDHHGGRMLFGSDGLLYLATGDEGDPAHSQDIASTLGKMLRMTANGKVPPGNPFGNLAGRMACGTRSGGPSIPRPGPSGRRTTGPSATMKST
jgi:glucose/arabinose dehydrogenase